MAIHSRTLFLSHPTTGGNPSLSLAAIHAGGPDRFARGTRAFLHNTITSAATGPGGQAVDAIQPSPTSYIVGQ